ANFNALMGINKPAEVGFDIMHFNLHKTFSTPHGGGGPGSGPVAVTAELADFLPGPVVVAEQALIAEDEVAENGNGEESPPEYREGTWYSLRMPARSIGRMKAFYGHFGVMVRAYTYIRMLGAAGALETSKAAVLNANYLQAILKEVYPLPFDRPCMHEFVLRGEIQGAPDIHALDISKRLIDYGMHPPTNYFPLIVPEALMIEPTETESKRTLDAFAQAMIQIAQEAHEHPEWLHEAPHHAPVTRLDEVRAARNPILRWRPGTE
ncbi:MAG: aminomethyl-transferring glycine dehydrogenase subunit GcvPB, partial [Chloroflexi bacterium]|nr:aminomethyl-transferring glycine dehydrogenase subunit GcvPB [Chloroflexota bacterium]